MFPLFVCSFFHCHQNMARKPFYQSQHNSSIKQPIKELVESVFHYFTLSLEVWKFKCLVSSLPIASPFTNSCDAARHKDVRRNHLKIAYSGVKLLLTCVRHLEYTIFTENTLQWLWPQLKQMKFCVAYFCLFVYPVSCQLSCQSRNTSGCGRPDRIGESWCRWHSCLETGTGPAT